MAKQAEDHGEVAAKGAAARPETDRRHPRRRPRRTGAPTKPITVREALARCHGRRDARRRDVFLIGEEVAQYQGAYKISQGLLEEFGPSA